MQWFLMFLVVLGCNQINCCVVPKILNGKVVISENKTVLKEGSVYDDIFGTVSVECNKQFALTYISEKDNLVICVDDDGVEWNKMFLECARMCVSSELITFSSHVTKCEFEGKRILCDHKHKIGTMAYVNCKEGYDIHNIKASQSLLYNCLSSGKWNNPPYECSPICGVQTARGEQLIVKGTKTEATEVPWNVAVYRNKDYPSSKKEFICGGTIITERLVISAAHCFLEENYGTVNLNPIESFKIVAGKYYRDFNRKGTYETQEFGVENIIYPPNYRGQFGNNIADIAVVVLDDLIIFKLHIAPVCVKYELFFRSDFEIANQTLGLVSGWGNDESDGRPSEYLKSIEVPFVPYDQCLKEASQTFAPFVTKDKLCLGFKDGSGACKGDSGAGLVFSEQLRSKKIYYLRGIVSIAPQTIDGCNLQFYTLYTNIQHYLTFIKNATIAFSDLNLIKVRKPIQDYNVGSCIIPIIPNGEIVDKFNSTLIPGSFIPEFYLVSVKCYANFWPIDYDQAENNVSCNNGLWSQSWLKCNNGLNERFDIQEDLWCTVPIIPNGKVVYQDDNRYEEQPGTNFNDFLSKLTVICNSDFTLVSNGNSKNLINCDIYTGKWLGTWPKCRKLCSKSEISGPTIKPHCQRDGATVECEEKIQPGTTATIQCKTGYRMPSMQHIRKELVCLASGGWDYEAIKCEPVCGVLASPAQHLIADGTDIEMSEAPWHVAIYKSDKFVCGGTLISESVVMSAAQCFFNSNSSSLQSASVFKVGAGSNLIYQNRKDSVQTQIRVVDKIITPEEYNGEDEFMRANIAAVIVKGYFEFKPNVAPACIEFTSEGKQPPHETIGSVTGWEESEDGNTIIKLKKINIPTLNRKTCLERAASGFEPYLTEDKLCVGYNYRRTELCKRDSGAGLLIPKIINDKEVFFIQGTFSNIKNELRNCSLSFTVVFSNIQNYRQLIEDALFSSLELKY